MDSIPRMPTTSAELEARVAALEADRVDYRGVLTAINALGENQRDLVMGQRKLESNQRMLEENQRKLESNLRRLESKVDDLSSRFRSMEENFAEVKDLLVRALDGR